MKQIFHIQIVMAVKELLQNGEMKNQQDLKQVLMKNHQQTSHQSLMQPHQ
jgi:hypothetical protein